MVSTIYSNLSGMIEGKEQVAEEKNYKKPSKG